MRKSVVLLSGGIDSMVIAEREFQLGTLAGCVFVDMAHPSQVAEGWKAFSFHGRTKVPLKTFMYLAWTLAICLTPRTLALSRPETLCCYLSHLTRPRQWAVTFY